MGRFEEGWWCKCIQAANPNVEGYGFHHIRAQASLDNTYTSVGIVSWEANCLDASLLGNFTTIPTDHFPRTFQQ
eukprot:5718262-Amphidinium_carterae.1